MLSDIKENVKENWRKNERKNSFMSENYKNANKHYITWPELYISCGPNRWVIIDNFVSFNIIILSQRHRPL